MGDYFDYMTTYMPPVEKIKKKVKKKVKKPSKRGDK